MVLRCAHSDQQENPDLFKWLTGQAQPPSELLHNSAFKVRCRVVCAMITTCSSS